VCSISGDPHKQGFSIYPAGAIIFRDEELLRLASFTATETGWTYSTPGLLGSRPGNTVAITWALFNYLGKEGYVKLSKKCMDLTMSFVESVQKIPGLECATIPKINLANVVSRKVNMDKVKERLANEGWIIFETNGKPFTRENAVALGIVPYHEKVLSVFLDRLEKIVKEIA
jgi:glutamate/tyrosine decarboxylase-like PLP-dependent enzyme